MLTAVSKWPDTPKWIFAKSLGVIAYIHLVKKDPEETFIKRGDLKKKNNLLNWWLDEPSHGHIQSASIRFILMPFGNNIRASYQFR